MTSNRRQFLSRSPVVAVWALAAAQKKAKAKPVPAADRLAVGFIGSGIRGTQLINDFRSIDGLQFPAVCDLYDGCLARAGEQLGAGIKTGKDYRAILDRKDIDAVVIATPDHLHERMVLDALSAGKHVYIEKPLTWTLEQGPRIIEAEKRSGKVLQVGSQGKTTQLTAKAREIVASGRLGKVTMIRMGQHRNNAQGAWKYPVPPDASEATIDWKGFLGDKPARPFDARVFFQWRCWWEFSGGVATDLFVHQLTWLHEVMQAAAPDSVTAQGGLYFWKDGRDVPDVMNALFTYPEGFVADLYVHMANGYPQAPPPMILGNKASLIVDGEKLILIEDRADHGVQSYGTLQWPKEARAAYFRSHGWTADGRPPAGSAEIKPEEVKIPRGLSHAELFIQSIRENKPSRENATEGHLAAGAAHLANVAYRKGKKMNWDWRAGRVWEA